ncbi:MAG: hypothetical protein C4538_13280 [Nitrospiraceae bacterium]|nr:MAG: hypothetical protein C4538_13280 [Nitrospiraceae bacterium]
MTKKQQDAIFSTLDIHLSAFLLIYGIQPILELRNGRVIFTFPATGELYKAIMLYNSNIDVHVADFVTAVKTLRGQMLTMRGQR